MITFKGWSINPRFEPRGEYRLLVSVNPKRWRIIRWDGQIAWEVKQ